MGAIYTDYFTDQSSTFIENINLNTDITGSTFAGQIRRSYTSERYVELLVEPVDETNIRISLDSSQTVAMKPGRYVFDVFEINSGGISSKRVTGTIEVSPSATKL